MIRVRSPPRPRPRLPSRMYLGGHLLCRLAVLGEWVVETGVVLVVAGQSQAKMSGGLGQPAMLFEQRPLPVKRKGSFPGPAVSGGSAGPDCPPSTGDANRCYRRRRPATCRLVVFVDRRGCLPRQYVASSLPRPFSHHHPNPRARRCRSKGYAPWPRRSVSSRSGRC